MYLQKDKAPVVYLLPGLLSGVERASANIHFYSGLGYHVVAIPNVWTAEVISKGLNYEPGDLPSEAKHMLAIMHEVDQTLIGEDKIASRHIVGNSYGAFVGAASFELSHTDKNQPMDSLTLFAPPQTLAFSVEQLDNLITQYRHYPVSKLVLSRIIAQDSNAQFNSSTEAIDVAKAVIAQKGFLTDLVDSNKEAAKIRAVNPIDGDNLTLASFMKEFYPNSVGRINSEQGNLNYWLDRLEKNDKLNTRVSLLTSDNDFLSQAGSGAELLNHYGPSKINIAVTSGGGHNFIEHGKFDKMHKFVLDLSMAAKSE